MLLLLHIPGVRPPPALFFLSRRPLASSPACPAGEARLPRLILLRVRLECVQFFSFYGGFLLSCNPDEAAL